MATHIEVTNSLTGNRLCFHRNFIAQVEPAPSGSVITVKGLGKIRAIESASEVKIGLKAARTKP